MYRHTALNVQCRCELTVKAVGRGSEAEFDQGNGGEGGRSEKGCTEFAHCPFTVEQPQASCIVGTGGCKLQQKCQES